MKKFFLSIFIIFLIIFYPLADIALSQEYKPAGVRIAVIKDADYITLIIKGKYRIFSLYTHQLLDEGRKLRSTEVRPTISGLLIGNSPFKIFGIRIEPAKEASIFIDKRCFRGSVDIIRTEGLKLLVVNHVDVENYLYGVLYHEVSPLWTMEALKAQAIVARTFALYESRSRKNEDYDLTSDVYSQVYGGRTSERWRTNRAVKLTKGKVLTYKGDIFPTYYHATCGGHTLDASKLWNIDIKPLEGVQCTYCEESPHYRWRRSISLSDIEERLKKKEYNIKDIYSIEINGRDKTGRVNDLILKGKNAQVKIPANKFRLAIGPNIIRSTNFEITLTDSTARFEGIGWGHGVGLCQWGSYLMSRKNPKMKVEEILKFYYPSSEIKNIRNQN